MVPVRAEGGVLGAGRSVTLAEALRELPRGGGRVRLRSVVNSGWFCLESVSVELGRETGLHDRL